MGKEMHGWHSQWMRERERERERERQRRQRWGRGSGREKGTFAWE